MSGATEMISTGDPMELIEDLSEAIEAKGIKWVGTDASLHISLGEYMAYFPETGYLVDGNVSAGDGVFLTTFTTVDDMIEHIEDVLNDYDGYGHSRLDEIADMVGETPSNYRQLFEDAKGERAAGPLLQFVFDVTMYGDGFFDGEYGENVYEFVANTRQRLNLDT